MHDEEKKKTARNILVFLFLTLKNMYERMNFRWYVPACTYAHVFFFAAGRGRVEVLRQTTIDNRVQIVWNRLSCMGPFPQGNKVHSRVARRVQFFSPALATWVWHNIYVNIAGSTSQPRSAVAEMKLSSQSASAATATSGTRKKVTCRYPNYIGYPFKAYHEVCCMLCWSSYCMHQHPCSRAGRCTT